MREDKKVSSYILKLQEEGKIPKTTHQPYCFLISWEIKQFESLEKHDCFNLKNGSICQYLESGYPGLHRGGKKDGSPCPYLEWLPLYSAYDWTKDLKDKVIAEKLRDPNISEKTWPHLILIY